MATTATIILSELQTLPAVTAVATSPYIWPAVVLVDDNTRAVTITAPPVADARVVMPLNSGGFLTVPIPSEVGVISIPIEIPENPHDLVLVVVLWEKSDTPAGAVAAGYQAFLQSLQGAVVANIAGLSGLEGQAAYDAALSNVQATVTSAVEAAIENALTDTQKAEVVAGILVPDGVLDNSFTIFSPMAAAPIALSFSVNTVGYTYEVYGKLTLGGAPSCAVEAAAVSAATAVVDGIEQQLAPLQRELTLKGLSAAQRAQVLAQIAAKEKSLTPAQARLAAANRALQACLAGA